MNPLIIPCPNRVPCTGIADSPVANLTSEAPDAQLFLATNFGNGDRPPIGDGFVNPGGFGQCSSTVSQLAADQCAQQNQVIDLVDNPGDGDGGRWTTPLGIDQPIFKNTIQSCTVLCPDGLPFTYQVAAGTYSSTSQAQADEIAASFACILANVNKVCLGSILPVACFRSAYNSAIVTTGRGPFTFTIVSGSLPPGLVMSPTGNISGTATNFGSYTFTVRAVNNVGNFMVKTYSITVFGFTNAAPASGVVGTAYSFQFTTSGGVGAVTFSITSGHLPAGLAMNSAGLISGTPTAVETDGVTVMVTDTAGSNCSKDYSLSVTSSPAWKICDFANVAALIGPGLAACNASAAPQWNGVFNLSGTFASGDPFYYFIGQSLDGSSVSADETPDYPNGPWQENDAFTVLTYNSTISTWFLDFFCTNGTLAAFYTFPTVNGTNPTGTYTKALGSGPTSLSIQISTSTCCPDSGDPVPVNFDPASPARVRISDLPGFVGAIGACPGCVAAAPNEWDGTMPLQCTTGPTNLRYFLSGGDCLETIVVPVRTFGGFAIQTGLPADNVHRIVLLFLSGDRWRFTVTCFDTPDKVLWQGTKLVGGTPQGTYIRDSGATGGVASGPACVHIESY